MHARNSSSFVSTKLNVNEHAVAIHPPYVFSLRLGPWKYSVSDEVSIRDYCIVMPLHLLGKKSWNVYNSTNIERVRRDEAEARAKEEAEEQRMQEEDAQRRIALLRGEQPAPGPYVGADSVVPSSVEAEPQHIRSQDDRRRKRRRGEDDTDRDIRYARQDAEVGARARLALLRERESDAPLQDHAGNIQLIAAPDEASLRKAEKHADAEAIKAQKRKKEEDQYAMRFSDAAGFAKGMEKPWYAANSSCQSTARSSASMLATVEDKDVWGNEDPLRKEREQKRISSGDPLAAMKQAQRQLKQTERDREVWSTKQAAGLGFRDIQRRKERNHEDRHRRRREEQDSLDGFELDGPTKSYSKDSGRKKRARHEHRRHSHHHHRRHRSRSRERDEA